jgi:hypothetical protein
MLTAEHSARSFLSRRLEVSVASLAGLFALDLLLLAACVLAARANASLRAAVSRDGALLAPTAGSLAPPIKGRSWSGAPEIFGYDKDARPTLVYTFTRQCPECNSNWRFLQPLQALAPEDARILYVDSTDPVTRRFLQASRIQPSRLLTQLSPTSQLAYGARIVPQLEMLDGSGRVKWSHIGPLTPALVAQMMLSIKRNKLGNKKGG